MSKSKSKETQYFSFRENHNRQPETRNKKPGVMRENKALYNHSLPSKCYSVNLYVCVCVEVAGKQVHRPEGVEGSVLHHKAEIYLTLFFRDMLRGSWIKLFIPDITCSIMRDLLYWQEDQLFFKKNTIHIYSTLPGGILGSWCSYGIKGFLQALLCLP